MYTTLIFDLSEVLIYGLKGIEPDLAPLLGIDPDHVLADMFTPALFAYFRGEIDEDTLLTGYIRHNRRPDPVLADMKGVVRRNFTRLVPGMEALVGRLAHTHELVLLSDHGREWIDFILAAHPFLGCFAQRFYSFDLGHTKQEPLTFTMVLQRTGRQASDCLFIDDSPANVACARSAGIDGLVFTSVEQLTEDLVRAGFDLG